MKVSWLFNAKFLSLPPTKARSSSFELTLYISGSFHHVVAGSARAYSKMWLMFPHCWFTSQVELISSKTQGDGLTNKQGQQKIPSAFPIRSQTSTPISKATTAVVKLRKCTLTTKSCLQLAFLWNLLSTSGIFHIQLVRLMWQNICYNTLGLLFESTICLKCGRVIMKVDDL